MRPSFPMKFSDLRGDSLASFDPLREQNRTCTWFLRTPLTLVTSSFHARFARPSNYITHVGADRERRAISS